MFHVTLRMIVHGFMQKTVLAVFGSCSSSGGQPHSLTRLRSDGTSTSLDAVRQVRRCFEPSQSLIISELTDDHPMIVYDLRLAPPSGKSLCLRLPVRSETCQKGINGLPSPLMRLLTDGFAGDAERGT